MSAGLGHHITLTFHAHKDKLVNESLTLTSVDNSRQITLRLMARILGKYRFIDWPVTEVLSGLVVIFSQSFVQQATFGFMSRQLSL